MAVRIKIATTPTERDALFRVRHRVFVEQDGYMAPTADHCIVDRFDAFPTTINLIAVHDDAIIGGIRVTEPGGAGLPVDEYFDFRPHLPRDPSISAGSGSMACIVREYRHRRRLASSMIHLAHFVASQRGISHLAVVCNPRIDSLMLALGYQRVAPTFRHARGLAMSPLLLDLRQASPRLNRFIRAHSEMYPLHSLDRMFFESGETVIASGGPVAAAHIVLDGVAVADYRDARGNPQRRQLRPGSMFGEVSLMTGRLSNVQVVAATDLDTMVLEGAAFRDQLLEAPELALALLETLGARLVETHSSGHGAGPRERDYQDAA